VFTQVVPAVHDVGARAAPAAFARFAKDGGGSSAILPAAHTGRQELLLRATTRLSRVSLVHCVVAPDAQRLQVGTTSSLSSKATALATQQLGQVRLHLGAPAALDLLNALLLPFKLRRRRLPSLGLLRHCHTHANFGPCSTSRATANCCGGEARQTAEKQQQLYQQHRSLKGTPTGTHVVAKHLGFEQISPSRFRNRMCRVLIP
jgi:hypothetical protein